MPLARFLGIIESNNEKFILETSFSDNLRNHLNTFHASVIFGFAEISSGVFLEQNFKEESETTIPVVRRANVKYSSPSKGKLFSKVSILNETKEEFLERLYASGKGTLDLQANIYNENDAIVFKGQFEWFVTVKPEYLKISKSLVDTVK